MGFGLDVFLDQLSSQFRHICSFLLGEILESLKSFKVNSSWLNSEVLECHILLIRTNGIQYSLRLLFLARGDRP